MSCLINDSLLPPSQHPKHTSIVDWFDGPLWLSFKLESSFPNTLPHRNPLMFKVVEKTPSRGSVIAPTNRCAFDPCRHSSCHIRLHNATDTASRSVMGRHKLGFRPCVGLQLLVPNVVKMWSRQMVSMWFRHVVAKTSARVSKNAYRYEVK